jgi:hypothetical protein
VSIITAAHGLHAQFISALYVGDPYPPKCDIKIALDPIVAFIVGQSKGVVPTLAYTLLFFLAILLIVWAKNAKGTMQKMLYIFGGLLFLGTLPGLLKAFTSTPC